jgi:hypothetical protein
MRAGVDDELGGARQRSDEFRGESRAFSVRQVTGPREDIGGRRSDGARSRFAGSALGRPAGRVCAVRADDATIWTAVHLA